LPTRCAIAARKGTLAVLELLANDVAGWPARAVEFYALLDVAQPINHLRLRRGRTIDVRDGDALDRLDGPSTSSRTPSTCAASTRSTRAPL